MKLYMHPISQHSRRVLMLCHELKLEPECHVVAVDKGEHKSDAFLAMNPAGQVPVLVDGDVVLAESHAIMKYIVDKAGKGELYPADPVARRRVDAWLDWTHASLNPPIQTLAIQTLFMGDNADASVVSDCHSRAAAALEGLERGLGSGEAIGRETTLADFAIGSTLGLFEMVGGSLERFPKVTAWLETIKARPSYQATVPQMG